MLYQIICPNCGAKSFEKINDTQYYCKYCTETFFAEKIENYAKELSKLLDSNKLEMVANAKQSLYAAITAEYISKNEVIKWCEEIKKYLPDDFQANFYFALAKKSKLKVAKMIREITVDENYELLEKLIIVVIKSLESSYVMPTKDLIERTFKNNDKNLEKYSKYTTWIEAEAEKLDNFIYDVDIERDAFIAYSSKDREKVLEVVDYLENEGFTCFVSMRNLRHGVGAQEKYEKFLKKAMDNCTSFIFISSMNSRDRECDALRIEISYIMQCDKANAPANERNVYSRIPYEYKKPRVEYRIQESVCKRKADDIVNNFFDGYEIAYTLDDVAERLWQQTMGIDDSSVFKASSQSTVEKKTKFCVACTEECKFDAKFCQNCGATEFADTKKEAELTKKLKALESNNVTPIVTPKQPSVNAEEEYKLGNDYYYGRNNKKQDYYEAVKHYRLAAEQGHAQAQCNLGNRYYYGEGVTKDYTEAVKWYRKSAEQGHAQAQCNLGNRYYYGEGVTKDYTEAVKWYRKSAEQGDSWAQCNLGNCYYNGNGVTKDYTEAVKWYRKSAEQGHAQAQCNLGNRYYYGEGVTKDYTEAVKWYRKSAEQRDSWAQCNLGNCYYNGNGVTKDYTEAVKWYRKSAEQGYADAQYMLGYCYNNGLGVTKDYTEAVKWYKLAADQEYAAAQNGLGYCYALGLGVEKNQVKAVELYTLAAEQGYARAQYNLGICYANGEGVTKDYTEAVKWYRKATEQGHAGAQNALGNCYYYGEGVTKDYTEAIKWYRKSAEQGNASAQNALGNCYYDGEGVTKDYTEAVKWYRKSAEQGNMYGQYNLGWCYAHGEGVIKNISEALKCYKLSADQGYESAKKEYDKLKNDK